jgi:hypothetical protein
MSIVAMGQVEVASSDLLELYPSGRRYFCAARQGLGPSVVVEAYLPPLYDHFSHEEVRDEPFPAAGLIVLADEACRLQYAVDRLERSGQRYLLLQSISALDVDLSPETRLQFTVSRPAPGKVNGHLVLTFECKLHLPADDRLVPARLVASLHLTFGFAE